MPGVSRAAKRFHSIGAVLNAINGADMFKFEMKNAMNGDRRPIETVELIQCFVDR